MTLAELFSIAREINGMTLRDLEAATGLSNAMISQLENGKIKNPGWFTVVKLANALNISVERLAKCAQEFPESSDAQEQSMLDKIPMVKNCISTTQ